MTTTDSPRVGSANRTPCKAIAPSVPKAPASKLTPVGSCTQRFRGTEMASACEAKPTPAQATRSPMRKSVTSSPTPITIPAALYPRAVAAESLSRTALKVFSKPSLRAFSITALTRSGRSRASWTRPFPSISTAARSVPELINDAAVRTSTRPFWSAGTGTSTTLGAPSFRFCRTCFIEKFRVSSFEFRVRVTAKSPRNAKDAN